MKILFVIPNLKKGGAERLVLDVARQLSSREGVEVRILTFREGNDYTDLSEGLDIINVEASIQLSIIGRDKVNDQAFEDLVRAYAPEVIHSHLFESEILCREHLFSGIRYFSHFHDNMPVFRPVNPGELMHRQGIARWYEKRRMLRKYKQCHNTFICISNHTLAYAQKMMGKGFKFHLLHNAIDFIRFYHGAYKAHPGDREIKLITIGSLVDNKNQRFLLAVMEILLKNSWRVSLCVLGDGPNRAALEAEVKTRHLEQVVTFKGVVHKVEEYIQTADIYVHAAFSESFGLVLLEAMAGGLPVVSLDGGGNRDIVLDGVNGYLLPEQDVALFADKIISLASNAENYERMSREAVNFAKGYDIKLYVDKLLDIYRSAD